MSRRSSGGISPTPVISPSRRRRRLARVMGIAGRPTLQAWGPRSGRETRPATVCAIGTRIAMRNPQRMHRCDCVSGPRPGPISSLPGPRRRQAFRPGLCPGRCMTLAGCRLPVAACRLPLAACPLAACPLCRCRQLVQLASECKGRPGTRPRLAAAGLTTCRARRPGLTQDRPAVAQSGGEGHLGSGLDHRPAAIRPPPEMASAGAGQPSLLRASGAVGRGRGTPQSSRAVWLSLPTSGRTPRPSGPCHPR
jgi:hypothetical protein